VFLINVYSIGVPLTGMLLMEVSLIGVPLIGVHLVMDLS
jgi:hypothetical protein